MQELAALSFPRPSAIQRFPAELVYPVVLELLGEQLEDIAFSSDTSWKNDDYPVLTLLQLCSVFRRCTVEVLEHMLGLQGQQNVRTYEIISALRLFRTLSRTTGNSVARDLVDSLNHINALKDSPVCFILQVYLYSRGNYATWFQDNKKQEERMSMPDSVQSISTVQIKEKYLKLPVWARHVLTDRIVESCIALSVHSSRMFSLSRVAFTLVRVLRDENINWSTHQEIGTFIANAYAEDACVCERLLRGGLKGHITRLAKWGLVCTIPKFTIEDAEVAGVRGAFEALMNRVKQGHISRADGRRLRDALPLYACMSKEEVRLLKSLADMSLLDEPHGEIVAASAVDGGPNNDSDTSS